VCVCVCVCVLQRGRGTSYKFEIFKWNFIIESVVFRKDWQVRERRFWASEIIEDKRIGGGKKFKKEASKEDSGDILLKELGWIIRTKVYHRDIGRGSILIFLMPMCPSKLMTSLRRDELLGLYPRNNRNASLSKFFELGSLLVSCSVFIC